MRFKFDFQGKTYIAEAQKIRGQLWLHFQGKTFVVENEEKKNFGSKASSSGKKQGISAPMPGKITKIFKSEGDLVKAGEAIIVMEAMKMEYTLKSEMDGVLQTISCKLGEQVSLGKELCRFQPA